MTSDRLIAGRYRLTDPIGTGAMGVVWRATDVRLRRTVAVKQLLLGPGLSKTQALEAKLRAMREGRIAARLHHPNAITVFDVAEEDEQPWLVMEFMDAPSLAARLSGKRTLPPTEVARIGAQAAGALAAAHDAGIMHRDVKPANLLVGDDGTVKITDFGISHASGDVTVTATGFLAGTPAYLAPEVARGEKPEAASDVFALGSTLYAAVEGGPPFGEGDNPLAVLHAVARGEVPAPVNAGALAPVLLRLLAPTSDQRPTMREAVRALEAVAAGRDPELEPLPETRVLPAAVAPTTVLAAPDQLTTVVPTTPPPTTPGTTALPSGSRRRPVVLAAVVAVAVLLIAGVVAVAATLGRKDETTAAPASSAAPASATPPPPAAIGEAPQQITPSTPPPSSPPSTPSSTPAPSTSQPNTITSTPFGPPAGERVAQFIGGYYGMLPGNVSGAWSQLAPSYQAQTGGYQSYAQFWSSVSSVRVQSITPSGDNRVVAGLTYSLKNGTTSSESRWFQVSSDGGRLLIAASGL
ncbi:serine/threonine protein kinase [Nocardia panacis]|uniref:non-specific serine/threonine protein kinase n=1 Tax=Nocardia panacis TaxID=2340916 RepID=A0A3A4K7K3_9NOCA|nr:serine/threonine-protein kinase [Nocardia panacis]RJO68204.1 serine/threonine protein kinase [Nocardia panacis]